MLGGAFAHAAGAHAGHLTAVDPVTGTASTWRTGAPAAVLDLAEEDGSVFAAIAGKGGMVATFAADGGGRLWQAQTDGNVQAITTAGGSVVAGGHFDNFCDLGTNCAHPVVRRKIAALDEGSGALDPTCAAVDQQHARGLRGPGDFRRPRDRRRLHQGRRHRPGPLCAICDLVGERGVHGWSCWSPRRSPSSPPGPRRRAGTCSSNTYYVRVTRSG